MGLFNTKTDKKKTIKSTDKTELETEAQVKVENIENKEESMKDLYGVDGQVKKDKDKRVRGRAYRVLLKPMVTEKATNLGSINQYVFMVANDANKIEIAKAIFEVYKVYPLSINIIKMKGKKVNRGRITGQRKNFKKAIITLKKGESISVYEGV